MEAMMKKYQQRLRKVRDEMDRWSELQSCLISQFRNASCIIQRLQVLRDSKKYGRLRDAVGIQESVLAKQMESLQNILLSMNKTMEEFHGIVLSLGKIHRDGRHMVKGCGSNQLTVKQLQQRVGVKPSLTREANKSIMDENDHLLHIFSKKTCAKLVHIESPTSLLGALRTRKISPITIFRGDLELSPKMKIKVWVYKKTSEEKFPTLKKYSDKAPPTDKFATHEVKVDFEYKSVEDPSKVVPPD